MDIPQGLLGELLGRADFTSFPLALNIITNVPVFSFFVDTHFFTLPLRLSIIVEYIRIFVFLKLFFPATLPNPLS